MRLYLAASYSRKEEIRKIADELMAMGFRVRARWLYEPDATLSPSTRYEFLRSRAEIDVEDVMACEVLVRFSDDLSGSVVPSHLATGSRMFEMGLAWANSKPVVVVGGNQCVFDYLNSITHVRDVNELKKYLTLRKQMQERIVTQTKCDHPKRFVYEHRGREICIQCMSVTQWHSTSIWWKPWTMTE